MTIKTVVPFYQAAQYDGTNSAEVIEVANLSGYGPFTVSDETIDGLFITSRGITFALGLGDVMLGTEVLSGETFGANWAEVTPIGEVSNGG